MNNINLLSTAHHASGSIVPAATNVVGVETSSGTVDAVGTSITSHLKSDQSTFSVVSGLLSRASADSEDRSAQIEALHQAIGSGTYSISAADVADKLFNALST